MAESKVYRDYSMPQRGVPFIDMPRRPLPSDLSHPPTTFWYDYKHSELYFLTSVEEGFAYWRFIPMFPCLRFYWSFLLHRIRTFKWKH